MIRLCSKSTQFGFSLAETLIAAGVSSIVLAGVAASAIAMRRTFEAANYHVNAQTEQLRLFDYLGRDIRSASASSVLDGGRRLDLVIPGTNSGSLALRLELPSAGQLRPSPAAASTNVSYCIEGDRLLRCVDGVSKEVARTVTDFRVTRTGSTMEVSATFSPKFARSPLAAAQDAMRLRTSFLLRNAATY